MIFIIIFGLFIPVFGAPDPHNLGRFAGVILILAFIEILLELILFEIFLSNGKSVPTKNLRKAEKLNNHSKKNKKR